MRRSLDKDHEQTEKKKLEKKKLQGSIKLQEGAVKVDSGVLANCPPFPQREGREAVKG